MFRRFRTPETCFGKIHDKITKDKRFQRLAGIFFLRAFGTKKLPNYLGCLRRCILLGGFKGFGLSMFWGAEMLGIWE